MPDLNGKVVFVTGASKGIGRAISEVFATNGATVVCASRTVADLEIVAHNIKENGGTAIVQQLDVSNMKDFQNSVKKVTNELGSIDVLVNNAIMQPQHKPFNEIDEEWWDYMMNLSLKGYFFACQKASKEMVKRNTAGSLICISSVHSFRAAKDWTPYGIAKMGIRRMVKGLAADLSGTGINSNCIAPGAINTFLKLIFSVSFIYILGIIWLGILIGWEKPIFKLGAEPFLLAELFKMLLLSFLTPALLKTKKLTKII